MAAPSSALAGLEAADMRSGRAAAAPAAGLDTDCVTLLPVQRCDLWRVIYRVAEAARSINEFNCVVGGQVPQIVSSSIAQAILRSCSDYIRRR